MHRTAIAAATVATIAAGAAFGIGIGTEPGGTPPPDLDGRDNARRGLVAYTSCDALLSTTRARAASMVGAWGLSSWAVRVRAQVSPGAVATAGASEEGLSDSATSPAQVHGFSGTNVQETGVDEPDIMKTDGTTMFTVVGAAVHATDVTGGGARKLGTLPLTGAGSQLLLSGDRLLVIGTGDAPGTAIERYPGEAALTEPEWGPQGVVLRLIDVSDPANMTQLETARLEGSLVSARLSGQSVRVVISTPPEIPAMTGPEGQGPVSEIVATLTNRQAIAEAGAGAWLPSYAVDRGGQPGKARQLVNCADVSRPVAFSGLGMVTVATLDLAKGVTPVDTDAIQTDGQVVYGSPTSLYVATTRWWGGGIVPADGTIRPTTEIHRFDTSAAESTEYRGSGEVDGHLLSQWSMSEHEGVLRVASTQDPTWAGTEAVEGESYVTTLDVGESSLTPRARVGGLGRGERIFAVRFMGAAGYVVTFRQTDPLYVVDLSDPGHPRVRGELKIPGYSAYLHPVGEGLLLGVGQDATEEGRVKGTQVSLFDVSDPTAPRRVSQRTFPGAWSEAESDHHAFLHWPATGLTVVPMQGPDADGTWSTHAVGMSVRPGEEIREVGRLDHPRNSGFSATIRRSAVIDNVLYTVSDVGVEANDLDGLGDRAWAPFS